MDEQNPPENTTKIGPAGKRNALGRGLSALMTATAVSVKPTGSAATSNEKTSDGIADDKSPPGEQSLFYLPLSDLKPNPKQPRREFSEDELKELSNSIRQSGLIQPLVVRKTETHYEIVAGERRFRAAKIAGLSEVPVILKQLSDRDTLAIGIVENVQRQDLNPLDEALAYQRLIEEFEETQVTVAQLVGKDRASIANSLRLLKLPGEVRELLVSGKISAGHGRAILGTEEVKDQIALAHRILAEGLSVRAVEKIVSEARNGGKSSITDLLKSRIERVSTNEANERLQSEISERIRRALGTKVNVKLTRDGGGEVVISFFSREELESLLERFETR